MVAEAARIQRLQAYVFLRAEFQRKRFHLLALAVVDRHVLVEERFKETAEVVLAFGHGFLALSAISARMFPFFFSFFFSFFFAAVIIERKARLSHEPLKLANSVRQ